MNLHEQELEALEAISYALGRYSGQERILHEVLDVLEHHLWFHHCTIMILSTDGRELVVDAVRNRAREELTNVRYSPGEGITGQVLETGKPAVIPRISDAPDFRSRVHARDKHKPSDFAFLCIPVVIDQDVVGTISADLRTDAPIPLPGAQRLLTIVSGLIANDLKARRRAQQDRQALEYENQRLRVELQGVRRPENIIGNSHVMQDVYQRIEQVAPSETTVLIRGESGTGKELVASAVHYSSPRCQHAFVKVNCAALNESLLESELFGHEKGAFTGAVQDHVGRIESAEGGTLFLDEIGDFSPAIQVKLLRVLQEKEYQRVGSNRTCSANVRIIAATNRDLEADVESGRFRQDLYYRINVFAIYLPPLRGRREDILLLADHFVSIYAEQMHKKVHRISTAAINMMMTYHWPGNVRELENCIEHAVLVCTDGVIHGYSLPPSLQTPENAHGAGEAGNLKRRIQMLEKDMILDALKRSDGNVAAASRELGITARMVRYKIKNLNIDYKRLFNKRSS